MIVYIMYSRGGSTIRYLFTHHNSPVLLNCISPRDGYTDQSERTTLNIPKLLSLPQNSVRRKARHLLWEGKHRLTVLALENTASGDSSCRSAAAHARRSGAPRPRLRKSWSAACRWHGRHRRSRI